MIKPYATNRILIALLFWDGDRAQAMQLARLLADLEPEHCKQADFLFVCRFDSGHSLETVNYVSRKFNVHTYKSRRKETGWPRGCNALFFGMLEFVYHKMAAGQIPNYKAIFVVGPDGAPIKKNWLNYLVQAWDVANKERKIYSAGALIPAGPHGWEHINGDAMFLSGDLAFLKWLTMDIGSVRVSAGWDWVLADGFKKWGWRNFPFVRSLWRREPPFTQENWDAENTSGVVWIHGVKNNDLLDLSRKNLLL